MGYAERNSQVSLSEIGVGGDEVKLYPTPAHGFGRTTVFPGGILQTITKRELIAVKKEPQPVGSFTPQEEGRLLRLTDGLLGKIGQFGGGLGVRRTATLVLAVSMLAGC